MANKVFRAAALGVTFFLLAACSSDLGSSRLRKIDKSAPRDTVLSVMGTGPLTATGNDSLRVVSGYRHEMFVINGKTYEVIYYHEGAGALSDDITRATDTPVVLEDGKFVGYGWKFYTDLAAKEKLPIPPGAMTAK